LYFNISSKEAQGAAGELPFAFEMTDSNSGNFKSLMRTEKYDKVNEMINQNLTKEVDCVNRAVFTVFVLPCLIGVIIRLMFLKWKRGYIIYRVFLL